MRLRRRRFLQLAGGAAALAAVPRTVRAQAYPVRPITMICPFPPGGATDAISRIIQDALGKALGQPIVVENVGGAGGMIAAARAARAANDGYTILIHQIALAAGMTLYSNLTFDAEKDFVTIGLVNTAASMLVGRPTLPPNDLKELIAWAKQPGQIVQIGHAGVGSYSHLVGVLIAQELGITATQIPYRGAGPATVDLMAGHVDLESLAAVAGIAQVNAGKLKAYAILGRKRFAGAANLPTMGELGYGKLDLDFWHMLLAPAGTPRPIVDRLNTALRATLADAKVQKTFADNGMDLFPAEQETPEAARALLKDAIKLWGDVIRTNHITGD
jgi:tripartite-type tricarboxylate transporter receptor subunit TctC